MSSTYPQFPATTFPDAVQALITYTDLSSSDATNYNLYRTAIEAGDFVTAKTYLGYIESGGVHKAISAGEINKLVDTLNAIQTYMTSSGWQTMVSQTQAVWQAIIDKFSIIGTWSASETYSKWNLVTHASTTVGQDGAEYLYMSLVDNNTNINPYDDFEDEDNPHEHWYRITIRGAKGSSGTTGTFQGDWDESVTYVVNDIVVYGGVWWSAVTQNINSEPSEDNDDWSLFLEPKLRQYPVSATQPTTQEVGDLWFEIV